MIAVILLVCLIVCFATSMKYMYWTYWCSTLNEQLSHKITSCQRDCALTCSTGAETRYFSRKARGAMSKERQADRWWRMDSMVCRGCCLVTRRYFCSGLDRLGKTAWAASYGLRACFRPPTKSLLYQIYQVDRKYLLNRSKNISTICFVTKWVTTSGLFMKWIKR